MFFAGEKPLDKTLGVCYYNKALADVAHLVERHLAKVEVASSSLVIRSIEKTRSDDRVFFVLFRFFVPGPGRVRQHRLEAQALGSELTFQMECGILMP